MSFLNPVALWALFGLLLLILFSLWRLKPKRRTEPSIRLWERLTDRRPPIRAVQSPRFTALLLLQALTLAALVVAWAVPAWMSDQPRPRKIAFVFDTSASMAPRMEVARKRARELIARLSPTDEVVIFPVGDLDRVQAGDRELDVRVLAEAVEADHIFVFTDEALSGFTTVGTGETVNTGIVHARRERSGVFVRLAHVGPPAAKEITVLLKGREVGRRTVDVDESGLGVLLPDGDEVRLSADEFPLDDRVVASASGPIEIQIHGEPDPRFLKALSVIPDVRIADRGTIHFHYGDTTVQPRPGHVVIGAGDDPFVPGNITLADHVLTRSLEASELVIARAREVPDSGTVVMAAGGRPVVVAGDRWVRVGMDWRSDGWPLYPSFPIFWSNVVGYVGEETSKGFDRGPNLFSERETLAPGLSAAPVELPPEPGRMPMEHPFDALLLVIALPLLIATWTLARE